MIPATYPSQVDSSNRTQAVIYYLPSITGLERWKDYIPVQESSLASPELNSFNTNGAILTTTLSSVSGKQAWVDYIPVYRDDAATNAWSVSATGYLATKDINSLQALAIIASYGADAHLYLPGIGVINGYTAGNFLDSAGTTAITVDNPVGLVLDAAGSVSSTELVLNNEFNDGTTSFTGQSGASLSASNGQLTVAGTGTAFPRARQDISKSTGIFKITIDIASVSVGAKVVVNFTAFNSASDTAIAALRLDSGVYTFYSNMIGISVIAFGVDLALGSAVFNSISVKEISGINATQATTANKPILRRGAVNLLTYSEDYSNAIWTKNGLLAFGSGSISNTTETLDPIGGNAADLIVEDTAAVEHRLRVASIPKLANQSFTYSIYVKPKGARFLQLSMEFSGVGIQSIFNVAAGTWTTFDQAGWTRTNTFITNVGNGWYRCGISGITDTSTTINVRASIASNSVGGVNQSYLGDGASGLYLWGAQLELGSTASTYIPTTTAAASSSTGNYYWQFDANVSPDSLALGSVPFQMADDHCVIAGCNNLSSAATSKVVYGEYGAGAQAVARISFETTTLTATWIDDASTAGTSPTGVSVTAGTTVVATARKVSNAKELRRNGISINTSSTAAGATTLTAARIGGLAATNYMNGNVFPVIAIKGTVTDADCLTLERFVGALSGVSI